MTYDYVLPRCPRHPEDFGQSEEHVFCLREDCNWTDELCWAPAPVFQIPLDPEVHHPQARCVRLHGHDDTHFAYNFDGSELRWRKKFVDIFNITNKYSVAGYDKTGLGGLSKYSNALSCSTTSGGYCPICMHFTSKARTKASIVTFDSLARMPDPPAPNITNIVAMLTVDPGPNPKRCPECSRMLGKKFGSRYCSKCDLVVHPSAKRGTVGY